jgi:hypothetical protein
LEVDVTIALLFWILMLLWVVGWTWIGWPRDPAYRASFGGGVGMWVLLFVLGWAVFGSPIKG